MPKVGTRLASRPSGRQTNRRRSCERHEPATVHQRRFTRDGADITRVQREDDARFIPGIGIAENPNEHSVTVDAGDLNELLARYVGPVWRVRSRQRRLN